MDISNPLRSLAPTVDGDVLAILAGNRTALTGRRVQQLAGRSYAQVRQVLHRLVADGLVDAERHGSAIVYCLNREHVLAAVIEAALVAVGEVEHRLRTALGAWRPAPAAVVLFGSFARRDGGPKSHVDLLLLRPDDVDGDDAAWVSQRHELARHLKRWTGNQAQIVEFTSTEFHDAVTRGDDLVAALRCEGRVLAGTEFQSLLPGP